MSFVNQNGGGVALLDFTRVFKMVLANLRFWFCGTNIFCIIVNDMQISFVIFLGH